MEAEEISKTWSKIRSKVSTSVQLILMLLKLEILPQLGRKRVKSVSPLNRYQKLSQQRRMLISNNWKVLFRNKTLMQKNLSSQFHQNRHFCPKIRLRESWIRNWTNIILAAAMTKWLKPEHRVVYQRISPLWSPSYLVKKSSKPKNNWRSKDEKRCSKVQLSKKLRRWDQSGEASIIRRGGERSLAMEMLMNKMKKRTKFRW